MKKLLLVLAIGATVAACNNNSGSGSPTDSSAAAPAQVDSAKPAMMDTTKHDSTSMMAPKTDSAAKK